MTLEALIKVIGRRLAEQIAGKITGQVTYTVNLSQGGIGSCKERIEKNLK
jgi:hypothetical protein